MRRVQVETCSVSPMTTMEMTRDEQCAALKFCFRLNKSSAEVYTMLQEAYGEFVLPYNTAQRWYKLFKEGRQSISKGGGPGAPVTALKEENINTAAVIVREDQRITLRSLSEILKISLGSTHMCVCVPMPTHCTITCFGFHTRWIDGVKCGLFSNHALLGQTTLRVGRVSVQCTGESLGWGDCKCKCLCSVIVFCGMIMKGREKVKPSAGS